MYSRKRTSHKRARLCITAYSLRLLNYVRFKYVDKVQVTNSMKKEKKINVFSTSRRAEVKYASSIGIVKRKYKYG